MGSIKNRWVEKQVGDLGDSGMDKIKTREGLKWVLLILIPKLRKREIFDPGKDRDLNTCLCFPENLQPLETLKNEDYSFIIPQRLKKIC